VFQNLYEKKGNASVWWYGGGEGRRGGRTTQISRRWVQRRGIRMYKQSGVNAIPPEKKKERKKGRGWV
jgi:hypothetical protein